MCREENAELFAHDAYQNSGRIPEMAQILEAGDLKKRYSRGANVFGREGGAPRAVAVNGVTFSIATGTRLPWSERAVAARRR